MIELVLPAVAKVVGSAVAKVATSVTVKKWDSTRLKHSLAVSTITMFSPHEMEIIEGLTTKNVRQLQAFIETPEFDQVTERYVIEYIRNGKDDAQHLAHRQYQELIRLYLDIHQQRADVLAKVVVDHVTPLIEAYFMESEQVGLMPKKFRGALVAGAAAQRTHSERNISVLESIVKLAPVEKFQSDICDQLIAVRGEMPVPSSSTNRIAPYNSLYVEPDLTTSSGTLVSMSSFLSERNMRVVVKGDPGGGKSTLAMKLALDLARERISWTQTARVPFILTLREFAKSMVEEGRTLIEQIDRVCRSPYQLAPPTGAIEYLLMNGLCCVIFDGLDELTDISVRKRLVDVVHGFANRYRDVPILVTSRRIGYEHAKLDKTFQEVSIGGFNDGAVSDYAHRWFELDLTILPDRRAERADSFVKATEDISDVRKNPLMLALMCSLYSSDGWIPNNRPELYERCSNFLYQQWDSSRAIESRRPFDAHIESSIYALALWMLDSDIYQEGKPRSTVVDFLTSFLLNRVYEHIEDAENAANDFLDFCTGRAWVLTDVGANGAQTLYGFTHRTFLEYFAAMQISREHPDVDGLYDYLAPYLTEGGRDVVAQICLQLLRDRQSDGAERFLRKVMAGAAVTPNRREISFGVRALGFVVPRPEVRRLIANICLERIETPSQPHIPMLDEETLTELLCSNAENLVTITDAIRECIEQIDRREITYEHLRLAAFTRAFAASNTRSFTKVTQGRFWTSEAPGLREIIYNRVKDSPTQRWWRLHLVSTGRLDIGRVVGSIPHSLIFEDNAVPGTYLPPFVTRLLYAMGLANDDYEQDDITITDTMSDAAAESFCTLILRQTAPWAVIPAETKALETPFRSFEPASSATNQVEGLFVLLCVVESEWRYALNDPIALPIGKVEYFHLITGDRYRGRSWHAYPGPTELLRFLQSWLGSAIHMIHRAKS